MSGEAGLLLYGSIVLGNKRVKDAVSVFLRLLVREPDNAQVKRLLAKSVAAQDGLSFLLEEIAAAATAASALAFLANSIKVKP